MLATDNIRYYHGGEEIIDIIQPLWEGLIEHHGALSPYFQHEFEIITFKMRKDMLNEKRGQGQIRIDVAEEPVNSKPVGYFISTISPNGVGEIESVFVEQSYRGLGIADCLMQRALTWMDELEVKTRILNVAAGNEQVFGFYARYGFYPRMTLLKQRK